MCVFLVFLTFDRFRTNMASFSGRTKVFFFTGLLIAFIPACTGLLEGQSCLSSHTCFSSASLIMKNQTDTSLSAVFCYSQTYMLTQILTNDVELYVDFIA